MNKTEFKVVSAMTSELLAERVNGFLAAGWSMQKPMQIGPQGIFYMSMDREIRETVNAMDSKSFGENVAAAMAELKQKSTADRAVADVNVRSIASGLNAVSFGPRIIGVVNNPRTTTPGYTLEILPGSVPCGYAADVIVVGTAAMYACDAKAFDDWVNDILRCRLNPGGYFLRIDK